MIAYLKIRTLQYAGGSRIAYYSFVSKESILPKSMIAISQLLDVQPSSLLEEDNLELQKARTLLLEVDAIMALHKTADRENIRHTLTLLQESPVKRLNRALQRTQ